MPVHRLSKLLGVEPSKNWTHVSKQGGLARMLAKGTNAIAFMIHDKQRKVLPTALFQEIFEELPAGGCAAEFDRAAEKWRCQICNRQWRMGIGMPSCALPFDHKPEQ